MQHSCASSKFGPINDGSASEFYGSIKTANNIDCSECFSIHEAGFRANSGSSDDCCLSEQSEPCEDLLEHGSTGDARPSSNNSSLGNEASSDETSGRAGNIAVIVGSSVVVGLVGLIALPVAIGIYGAQSGFSRQTQQEEQKEPVVTEPVVRESKVTLEEMAENSPDTRASSCELTPIKAEPRSEKFQPIRESLTLSALRLPSTDDKEARSKVARFEHLRLQKELQTIEELMQGLFDKLISELNKAEPDTKMVEQMEAQIENV